MAILAARCRRFFACLLLLAPGLGLAAAPGAAPSSQVAVVLRLDGAIGPASADYLARGFADAAERRVAFIILRMDTPGGLDTAMRDIVRGILASPVPVVTYVHPSGARAASAGTYILYASHVAAMTPGTNLGAATPVAMGGGGAPGPGEPERREDDGTGEKRRAPPGNAMEAKIVNDAAAYLRGLADLRGRNAEWAEKAVREGASLTAREALEQNVITFLARDIEDLLAQMDGRTVAMPKGEILLATRGLGLEFHDPDWRTRFLAAITNPNVALILLMIGVYGLIFEFMSPGVLYPGIIGAICLLVGLYALAALPVSFAGVALVVLGISLMVAEAFAPSFGSLGIGGAIALVLGATILIDTDVPGFETSWSVVGGIAVTSLAFALLIGRLAVTSRRHRVVSGREAMIGAPGTVLDWAGGSGHVLAQGERWQAVCEVPLTPGRRVRVIDIEGLTLTVEPDHETS